MSLLRRYQMQQVCPCFQAHIVKEYEEGSCFAFLASRSIDEIVQKERFYKDALQKSKPGTSASAGYDYVCTAGWWENQQ
ncbi:MAG: hypothetical protein ACLTS6_15025 [Anaerobutyricum sp.]